MKLESFENVEEQKVEDSEAKDVFIRVLIGPDDGADKFHMRRFRVLPGGFTPFHAHEWEHEVYILEGSGELTLNEGPRPFGAGDAVFVPAGLKHQFKNTGLGELAFLCLIPAVNPA